MWNRGKIVDSEEEDEDGNLSEPTRETETLPVREVVYLPVDTSHFKPEDNDDFSHTIPFVQTKTEPGGDDSDVQIIEETSSSSLNIKKRRIVKTEKDGSSVGNSTHVILPEKRIKTEFVEENNPVPRDKKGENKSSDKNVVTQNTIGVKNTVVNNTGPSLPLSVNNMSSVGRINNVVVRKPKYARQATPICDAIMKEYSKRQKKMLTKGTDSSEFNDLPIKDLLKKAKAGKVDKIPAKTTFSNQSQIASQVATVNVDDRTNSQGSSRVSEKTYPPKNPDQTQQSDPLLPSVKQEKEEIVDVKLFCAPIEPPIHVVDVKPVTENIFINNEEPSTSVAIVQKRGRGRPLKSQQIQCQENLSLTPAVTHKRRGRSRKDDIEEDPNYDPFNDLSTQNKSSTLRRVGRKSTLSFEKQSASVVSSEIMSSTREKLEKIKHNLTSESVATGVDEDKRTGTQGCSSSNPEALSVATRLKSLVEKITEVLSKDPCPKIDTEAEKLLQTTQELLELQKKFQQQNPAPLCQDAGRLESPFQLREVRVKLERIDVPEHDTLATQNNSLIKSNQNPRTISPESSERLLCSEVTPTISSVSSVQDKFTFIMEYFSSYTEIFNEELISVDLPVLVEIVLLCLNDYISTLSRIKKNKHTKLEELRKQETELTKQSFNKMMSICGKKFLDKFKLIVAKIRKTKTDKAIMVTFIFFIMGSLFMKDPKYKREMHRIRWVLLSMLKVNNSYDPLVFEVLEMSNETFERNLKILIQILKYFKSKNFISFPSEKESTSSVQKDLFSLVDLPLISEIFPSVSTSLSSEIDLNPSELSNYQRLVEESPVHSVSSVSRSNKLSDIAVQFVETLQSERQCTSKRIEEKLDYILSFLSGKSDNADSLSHLLTRFRQNDSLECPDSVFSENNVSNKSVRNTQKRFSSPNHLEQIKSNETLQSSSSGETSSLLSQVFENDYTGLDSLFESYAKSTLKEKTKIKTEPVDWETAEDIDNSNDFGYEVIEKSASQPFFVDVKQEPEDPIWTDTLHRQTHQMSTEDVMPQDYNDPLSFPVSSQNETFPSTSAQAGEVFTLMDFQEGPKPEAFEEFNTKSFEPS